MTLDEAKRILSNTAEAIAVVMHEIGVKPCEWSREHGEMMVVGPMWIAPVPISAAVGLVLGHAVAQSLKEGR